MLPPAIYINVRVVFVSVHLVPTSNSIIATFNCVPDPPERRLILVPSCVFKTCRHLELVYAIYVRSPYFTRNSCQAIQLSPCTFGVHRFQLLKWVASFSCIRTVGAYPSAPVGVECDDSEPLISGDECRNCWSGKTVNSDCVYGPGEEHISD
ncbi:hypothetical protein B0H12DRAFT_192998 [Mycena haematopus]|nr:hypothetical protein B0H12DRAFT_192998 [Mycena haematopus]